MGRVFSAPSPRWTPEEVAKLQELHNDGVPYPIIAQELGKTEAAIKGKVSNYGAVLQLETKKYKARNVKPRPRFEKNANGQWIRIDCE
jgi:hypothetical protein